MASNKPFYITTTLPYVNSDPHVGFAGEIIRADIIARYHKLLGEEVFFNTGTDEHGLKIYRNAQEAKEDTQKYVDKYAERFKGLKDLLGISSDINFIRTTDKNHIIAAQEFWKICDSNGYIYKKNYKIKYCVGCELEKTDSELENDKCPIHPNLVIEIIEEENYFFKFSEFQKPLLEFYEKNPNFVVPDFRFNEIKAFVNRGLEDFSISRLKSKVPWGIEVPGDNTQIMYVWFDALVNYISALGWPDNNEKFEKIWGTKDAPNAIQYAGKDNLRQQSAMWQAMLMAAGLPNSKQIVIGGFVNSGGQKMSKSLGNVIDPYKVVEEYGTDALRYFMARECSPFEDSDFTMERFKEAYNANLANGLGNLVSRVLKMTSANDVDINFKEIEKETIKSPGLYHYFKSSMDNFEINKSSDLIWKLIKDIDQKIQETEPFKIIKTDSIKAKKEMKFLAHEVYRVTKMLEPIMPQTSEKIKKHLIENKMPEAPLFPRKELV